MGSVLRSQTCHYCGDPARSEDHIVPRADLPKPMAQLPYWFRSQNVVPACLPCNGKKADLRSDCTCEHCSWAWCTALACFLAPNYRPRGHVGVVRSPG